MVTGDECKTKRTIFRPKRWTSAIAPTIARCRGWEGYSPWGSQLGEEWASRAQRAVVHYRIHVTFSHTRIVQGKGLNIDDAGGFVATFEFERRHPEGLM